MRIVFMGTPAIAAACLRALLDGGEEIVCVYTKPDTPRNRGMKLAVSEVKAEAESAGLPVRQPAAFRGGEEEAALRALAPDLIAVVAYGKILPRSVLELPPRGCVNIHASLLPALRGSAPVQWAVLRGFAETGVTAQYMAAEVDAGDVIAQKATPIDPGETAGELLERLTPLAARLLLETVRSIGDGTARRTPQDASRATFAPMLDKSMSPVDWTRPPREVVDHIRGLHPWPVATAELAGHRFKLHRAAVAEEGVDAAPGTILRLTRRGLAVACGGGAVWIEELQAEGGRRMSAEAYFRGHPLPV